MWDERYADKEYVYGTEPNTFLAKHADKLNGPVLSIAEGEGRNAVFLATGGLDVLGVDGSEVGLQKAQQLAQSKGVNIHTEVADLAEFTPKENHYGAIISISAHLPPAIRQRLYPLLERSLKPGGILLLEAYSEDQLGKETGGPNNIDMLMSKQKIENEFPNLHPLLLQELDREIHEGKFHTGIASVVQFIGQKKHNK
ncbi:class I SAM-dependent methyltransferase [Alteromonas sp. 14N.309.X.WAT.G.H12]|uniref:class I SAM-dependent methyltransferase n=1 Tax=Alteromonas sp. 14N.309.X.WAT.G.H12 TaxID=3120824 RepID=UPI002FD3FF3E